MNVLRKTLHQSIKMSPHSAEKHSLQRWIRKEAKTKLLSHLRKKSFNLLLEMSSKDLIGIDPMKSMSTKFGCKIQYPSKIFILINLKPNIILSIWHQIVIRCIYWVKIAFLEDLWGDSKSIGYSIVACLNSLWCGATWRSNKLKQDHRHWGKANQASLA